MKIDGDSSIKPNKNLGSKGHAARKADKSFEEDEFTATVGHSEKEACDLVEAGFQFVCDFNRNKIFRKLK